MIWSEKLKRQRIKMWNLKIQTHRPVEQNSSWRMGTCLAICGPMACSMPGFPVLHYLPEFTQTHVHWGADAIQPSHPLIVGKLQIQEKMVLSCHQGAQASPHLIPRVLIYQLLLLNRQQVSIWPLLCLRHVIESVENSKALQRHHQQEVVSPQRWHKEKLNTDA